MAIALYARKSIERENSLSCESQLEYCRAMLKPDERGEEILEFIDNGFTGSNMERDSFKELLKLIKQGRIRKLVVYKIDRVSRNLRDFTEILELLKTHNVEFVSSQESYDTSTIYGEMITKILMVFAEYERSSIVQRVTQAYDHRSDLGIYMGGKTPYGFTFEPAVIHGVKTKKLVRNDIEAEQVRYLFEGYAVQGVSLRRLMANLVANNIMPTSGSWSTAKISAILRNPIYVKADSNILEYFKKQNARIVSDYSAFDGIHGVQLYGQSKHKAEDMSDIKVVVMSHEGIVSSELWLKCQARLSKNKAFGPSLSNKTSWLGGLVICKDCGRKMAVSKGTKKKDGSQNRYFNCSGKRLNMICDGPDVTIYAEALENTISKLITEKINSFSDVNRKKYENNSTQINLLKIRLNEISAEENKIVDLLMNCGTEVSLSSLLNDKAKALSEEREALLAKLDTMSTTETEVISISHLLNIWEIADFSQKKSVATTLINKIYIHRDGTCEVIWNI